jgi:hypothetical protein
MKKKALLFSILIIVFFSTKIFAKPDLDEPYREEICLNGIWEIKIDGTNEFVKIQVPASYIGQDKLWGQEHWDVWGFPKKWQNKGATYKRYISIPSEMKGKRCLINFKGIRHVGRVEVNGKLVGKWNDPYVPFEFDITDAIKSGQNEVFVFVNNVNTSGLFEDYNTARRGIYRDVNLKFIPEVHVEKDVYIQTSVAKKSLNYQLPIINSSNKKEQITLRFKITDSKGKLVKTWNSDEKVTLLPLENKTVTVSQLWDNPHLWSIDDPNLYFITTEILNAKGRLLDSHELRFGFREITWNKHRLYLNGNEIFLRGDGGHPIGDLQSGKVYSEAWIRQLKEQGVELVRLHDLPRHAEMYDAADEMGFLLISEASHHFRLPPKEQAISHMEGLVKWLRNHPSVLMWSVANELHWRNFEEPAYLIELCNKLDPTRPAFNSDFSKWSRFGNVISHHYDAKNIWTDWEEYGPEKVMVWDEIGNVWQHDRPLKTGPAGIEVSSQDVATGTWRDGWEMLRKDIESFADGKVINNDFYRVNIYIPWELCYNFYRFQPTNNFQKFYPKYGPFEGSPGMKPLFINPGSSTLNIWDPTLPPHDPNPAMYCFNEFLARVRFPNDSKFRTYFSGETIIFKGCLFYEDHRPADKVEFRVETLDGKLLTSVFKNISIAAGAYLNNFDTQWQLPKVDTITQVRLVREFSHKNSIGYRKITDVKILPHFKGIDLNTKKIAVFGATMQKLLNGKGVPVSEAKIIVAEAYDTSWEKHVANGTRVLIQTVDNEVHTQTKLSHSIINVNGKQTEYSGSIKNLKLSEKHTMTFGTSGQELSNMESKFFNIQQPLPGAWMTFDFSGVINCSKSSLLQIDYGLWKNPGKDGYDKVWTDNGGAPFYQKKIKILISDSSGQWFASADDEVGIMTRNKPTAYNGILKFNCSTLSWTPIKFDGKNVVNVNKDIKVNLSEVVGTGVLFIESNPSSQVQIKSIDIKGGALPAAYVQPGSSKHKLLDNLGQEDFSFWRGGSSLKTLPIPETKNSRRLLFGNKDGVGSALQEIFIGKGIVLESALNIQGFKEPAAALLFNRMIDYLDDYKSGENTGKVSLVGNGFFSDWVKKTGVNVLKDPKSTSKLDIIIVDARDVKMASQSKEDINNHLKKGGTVLFSQVTPESIDLVREISGKPLKLTTPFFNNYYNCIKAPVSWKRIGSPHEWVDYYDGVLVPYPFEPNLNPLLSGIANIDLEWDEKPMFKQGIEIEHMNPVYAVKDYQILISNWHIGSESTNHLFGEQLNGVRDLRQNAWFVNRDAVLMEMEAQGGKILISQFDFQSGGEKAQRILQTLMTNLGVSFNGAMPNTTDKVYDETLRKEQLARFQAYNQQIEPVERKYYGVPSPLPDYLEGTKILKSSKQAELPTLLFLADQLTLGMNNPLANALEGVAKMSEPIILESSLTASDIISKKIGEGKFDRVVLSIGENDIDKGISDEEFRKNLETIWRVLNKKSSKIYWIPIPSAFSKDKKRAAEAERLNIIADAFFESKEVYNVPFVYKNVETLPVGYFSGRTNNFTPNEAKELAIRLADAVISFGAQ